MKKTCNPKPLLKDTIGEVIQVKLKNLPIIYKGYLISVDDWVNIHLINSEEIVNNVHAGKMGETFVKCSSILAILIDKRDILIEKKIQKDEKK